MKTRHAVIVVLLATSLVGMSACSRSAGLPGISVGSSSAAPATVTVTATAPASISASSPVTSPPDSTTSAQSEDDSVPESSAPESSAEVTGSPDPAADDTTVTWVTSICKGMGSVLTELVEEKPKLAADVSVGSLRQAMVDYYALSTKTASAAYSESQAVAAPHVADGVAIHQAYQHFLGGLVDVFDNAALDMSDATDLAGVKSVNNRVDSDITTLGTDNAALRAMNSGELAKIATNLPACQQVRDTANGA